MHRIGLMMLFAAGWVVAVQCQGATVIVGQHELRPNAAAQTIPLRVTGGDLVQGLNLRVQIADGGTHPAVGGAIHGPVIESLDLLAGTIFDGNHSGQQSILNLPQVWVQAVTTSTGTVVADGLLATLTVDTTGFDSGEFTLALANTRDGPTDFAGVPIDIQDGTIRIIPEPAAILLLPLGVLCWLGRRRFDVL